MTHYRQAINADINQLLDIEYECFPSHLGKDFFENALRQYKIIVAEIGKKVVGYIIYYVGVDSITLYSVAVRLDYRRQRIATQLLEFLNNYNKDIIETHVPEKSLEAQLFFKNKNFRCNKIIREYFVDDNSYFFVRNVADSVAYVG